MVTGSARNYEMVTGSARNYEMVTGSAKNYEMVTGSAKNYEMVTGSSKSYEMVTGSARNYEMVTGSAKKCRMITPSKHAGSDPEAFQLGHYSQHAARIKPDHISRIRLPASISVPFFQRRQGSYCAKLTRI